MRIRLTRLNASVSLPAYSSAGAAAFDLAAGEDCEIPPGQIRLVGTGLVIHVPDGYFLAVIARSSTPFKRGLIVANAVGVIDYKTAPEWKADDVTDQTVNLERGARIAQGIVLPAPRVEWEEVAATAPSRGGFGSTGV